MSSLAAPPAQSEFARALLDARRPCPPGLRRRDGADPATRFAVHRNNVVVSLVEALADTFPVTLELVGAQFFNAMAGVFVREAPPRSPVLALYGDAFADFVERFEPARSVPYLADVARLEYLRVRALHAADAGVLCADDIASQHLDHAALPATRLALHPSAGVLASRYAVVALWAAHHGVGSIAAVDPCRPESALVVRQADEVAVIAIDGAGAAFFRHLIDGATLGAATSAALAFDEGFDLAASLAVLISHGALSGWQSGAAGGA